jgi:hypothetical protein
LRAHLDQRLVRSISINPNTLTMDNDNTPPSRVRPSLEMTPKRHSMPAPPRTPFPPKSPGQMYVLLARFASGTDAHSYVPTKDGWVVASGGSPVRGTPPQSKYQFPGDRCIR